VEDLFLNLPYQFAKMSHMTLIIIVKKKITDTKKQEERHWWHVVSKSKLEIHIIVCTKSRREIHGEKKLYRGA